MKTKRKTKTKKKTKRKKKSQKGKLRGSSRHKSRLVDVDPTNKLLSSLKTDEQRTSVLKLGWFCLNLTKEERKFVIKKWFKKDAIRDKWTSWKLYWEKNPQDLRNEFWYRFESHTVLGCMNLKWNSRSGNWSHHQKKTYEECLLKLTNGTGDIKTNKFNWGAMAKMLGFTCGVNARRYHMGKHRAFFISIKNKSLSSSPTPSNHPFFFTNDQVLMQILMPPPLININSIQRTLNDKSESISLPGFNKIITGNKRKRYDDENDGLGNNRKKRKLNFIK